ncbi:group 4 capsule polysaccharide lipoprotein GfcB/YjbF [Phaeovulum vinaykumarii]|nr:group 4 capsule polysaccharide lipoprotein GfcB/YjbF [Phaeovulum vinaykumarii]
MSARRGAGGGLRRGSRQGLRRGLGVALALTLGMPLALGACSSDRAETEFLRAALPSFGQPRLPKVSERFTRAAAHRGLTYMVAVENRENALGIFVEETPGARATASFISQDDVGIALRNGFLVGTRGLGDDLLAADESRVAPLVLARRPGVVDHFYTVLGPDAQAVRRATRCVLRAAPPEVVDLGPEKVTADVMTEDCNGTGLSFQNAYWIERGTTRIVQSRQWGGPVNGSLALRETPWP